MADWKIHYADGSTYSNEDGSWEDAPAWGIAAIVVSTPECGWAMIQGGDYFIMNQAGDIIPIDDTGWDDYAANVLRVVKVGRMLSREEWQRIYTKALKDRDFAIKNGYLPRERKPD